MGMGPRSRYGGSGGGTAADITVGTTTVTGGSNGDILTKAAGLLAVLTPGTGVSTALAINIGSAGAPVLFNGAGGTPSSLTLTSATGLPISTGVSGLGTGIATALAVNTGSAGAPVLFNGAGGTPSSIVLTNASGTASININGTVGGVTPTTASFTTIITGRGTVGTLALQTAPPGEATGIYSATGNDVSIASSGTRNFAFQANAAMFLLSNSASLIFGASNNASLSWAAASTLRVGDGGVNANGTISAAAYVSGGSAGVDFGPSVVTSITVKKGIITAIS